MANGFTVDVKSCIGCRACETACKERHDLPVGVRRRRVVTKEYKDGSSRTRLLFVSLACNHCENPACVEACPQGALSKDSVSGLVKYDSSKCVGCRRCEWACPYGAPQFDSGKMNKCDGCDGFSERACAATCPVGALSWGSVTPDAQIAVEGKNLLPNPGLTNPNLKFDNKP